MGRRRRRGAAALVLGAVAAAALVVATAAVAAFGARTQNERDTVTAAPDFTAPVVSATAVAKSQGGTVGFVRKGGTYFAYANVAADTGNPASGLATVRANLAELTSGQTEAILTVGTYTVGGATYNYRSAELTASSVVEGARQYTVTAADNAGNALTVKGSATVDNVAPTAADIQTVNGGTTVGLAQEKDTIAYTFSEPIEPGSILAGWNGTTTAVVVRLADNGILGLPTGNDEVLVYNAANTAQLPLGAVDMGRGDYVAGLLGGNVTFGASGAASTMTMSGNTVTITLGTPAGTLVAPTTAAGTGTMVWTPVATPYDRAGNAMSTSPATESGVADKDF